MFVAAVLGGSPVGPLYVYVCLCPSQTDELLFVSGREGGRGEVEG